MNEQSSPLAAFGGIARLFPLPNLVLFPQVMQPLHIFEPRYRQMTADALAGDRLIALVLLRPGWETDYEGAPAIHCIGCLGNIAADQMLDDGRYNILLRGLSRIQIVHEIAHGKLYRKARVELVAEVPVAGVRLERKLRQQMIGKLPGCFRGQKAVLKQFQQIADSEIPLGALCDILAFALPLDAATKQALLEELEVEERVRTLLAHLDEKKRHNTLVHAQRKFPPEFSAN
jgi:Lon protease-like protein